jgi:hypothetical protein
MSRFRYHASAVGASGSLYAPYNQLIPAQASAALPEMGGVAHTIARRLNNPVMRFERAKSELVGRYDEDDKAYETGITVVVERLNILDMVTADRIVARLISKHPQGEKEPSISLTGSHFENLRVAGKIVEPDLATGLFARFPKYSDIASAYYDRKREEAQGSECKDGSPEDLRDLLKKQWSPELRKQAPERVAKFLPEEPAGGDFEKYSQPISVSLVRDLGPCQDPIMHYGHIIEIDGFGVIRLYELDIGRNWKRLTMLNANLGCSFRADMMCCSVAGNGDDW